MHDVGPSIQERFEAPPFPDITVCKMNPPPAFEASVVEDYIDNVDSVRHILREQRIQGLVGRIGG